MKFDILTLFPEMFTPIRTSMTGRAEKKGLLDFNIVNIRDYSLDKHKKTDDTPFGGGHGMVMMTDPIFRALKAVGAEPVEPEDAASVGSKRIVYMSPRGRILDKAKIEELSREDELVILCGHYEGVDQRVIDHWGIEEISIGDYILTGGELAAMVLIDSVSRLIPGVLAKDEAVMDESVYSGLLEYPQYTQPREYEGLEVPEILLNGNHELIDEWKFEQSLLLTRERRPDLFRQYFDEHIKAEGGLSKRFRKILEGVAEQPYKLKKNQK
ncbi:MAG: tRNA (guanosine(37)-N1)-methyltransferase TrmD [Eubacterium sp.]|nr:tRNA (guanosine(37)-N1)-methyltransferase TrmD [Eubacterium sp.]